MAVSLSPAYSNICNNVPIGPVLFKGGKTPALTFVQVTISKAKRGSDNIVSYFAMMYKL